MSGISIVRASAFATFLALICATVANAQDTLKYVKKDTREATRLASLEASGASELGGSWHVIGPFEGKSFGPAHPPEKARVDIDLTATYPGKNNETVAWQQRDFPDGKIHSLKLWKQSNDCVCYLYRKIEAKQATHVRVGLGSDDQIALWLNGDKLFKNESVRPAAADQDFVTLALRPGTNELLIKVGNVGGDWQFYFRPTISGKLDSQLERQLDRDFPPGGEASHYRLVSIPLPDDELIEGGGLAFRGDGKLYVGTRRGDVWLVENPLDEPDQVRMKPYVRGLHEVLGMTVSGKNDLYVVQRPEISLLRDTDGDDRADSFTTICDKFGCSGDYHEYIFGPARDKQGDFFVTLNVGFGGGHQAKVPYRGFCLKVSPTGEMTPWAFGLRSPNGVNFAPDGRLYYCDNQGEWVASCKMHEIRRGEFYGHAASVRWWKDAKPKADPAHPELPEMTPPALWFPYSLSKSTTEPIWDTTDGKFGPFAGQAIIGELTNSLLMRANLEEVQGRMQGACFLLRKGFGCGVNRLRFAPDGSLFVAETNRGWGSVGGRPHGLDRLIYTGVLPYDIHSMTITPTGWKLNFTKPVNREAAANPKSYFLESYRYNHWATYGSPEIDRKEHAIAKIDVSADGKSVHLTVPEREKLKVYHVKLSNLPAADGGVFLPGHDEAFYTANAFPE